MDGRVFTEAELGLLVASRHGRLVSLGADDTPQIHAVSFVVDAVSGCIDISGPRLRDSQKYRNIRHDPRVTLIVDDDNAEAHDLATAKGRKLVRPKTEALTLTLVAGKQRTELALTR